MTIYEKRRLSGVCTRCGRSLDGDSKHSRCEKCRNEDKELRQFYLSMKICPVCKAESLWGDEKTCLTCKVKKMEYNRKYTERRKGIVSG